MAFGLFSVASREVAAARAGPDGLVEVGGGGWRALPEAGDSRAELFFPIAAATSPTARQAEAARAICGRCAVRANCLSYALENVPEGIWGGLRRLLARGG